MARAGHTREDGFTKRHVIALCALRPYWTAPVHPRGAVARALPSAVLALKTTNLTLALEPTVFFDAH